MKHTCGWAAGRPSRRWVGTALAKVMGSTEAMFLGGARIALPWDGTATLGSTRVVVVVVYNCVAEDVNPKERATTPKAATPNAVAATVVHVCDCGCE